MNAGRAALERSIIFVVVINSMSLLQKLACERLLDNSALQESGAADWRRFNAGAWRPIHHRPTRLSATKRSASLAIFHSAASLSAFGSGENLLHLLQR